MDYEQFITEIKKYWDLRKKGLKKQANSFLFTFTKSFKENVPDADADAILFQFCREYLDEMKFPGDSLPRRHLPFQITELLDSYLKRECEKNKMPQMRWAYQIFGNRYNPHDPMPEHDFDSILKRAYMHEKCDPQTVQLYFREQLESLWWGQHHFPESCGITEEEFENIVGAAKKILAEKTVEPQLVKEFLEAHEEAALYINENMDEARSIVNAEIESATGKALEEEIIQNAFTRMTVDTQLNKDAIMKFAEISKEEGFISEVPEESDVFTTEFN